MKNLVAPNATAAFLFGRAVSLRTQLVAAVSFSYTDWAPAGAPGSPWGTQFPPAGQADNVSGRLHLAAWMETCLL